MKNDYFDLNFSIDNGVNLYSSLVDFEDKEKLFLYHLAVFRKRLLRMFKWEGLPEEITERNLELQTQNCYSIIVEHKGKLFMQFGGLGGFPDFNYMPTFATIANPAQPDLPHKFRIYWGYEFSRPELEGLPYCVVIPNDSLFMGTLPTNSYYASQLTENDLTLNCNLINFRLMNLLVAGNQDAYKSLKGIMEDLKKGKISSALDDRFLSDKILSLPFGKNEGNTIVQLLEQRQYIKGSFWNEWGVQSNYNMKRESITSSENILNVDSLLSTTDDMLEMRKKAIERIDKIFNVKLDVDFSSAWKKLRKELKTKEDILQKEAEEPKENPNIGKEENKEDKGGEDNE